VYSKNTALDSASAFIHSSILLIRIQGLKLLFAEARALLIRIHEGVLQGSGQGQNAKGVNNV
jgi:hypothetical protein